MRNSKTVKMLWLIFGMAIVSSSCDIIDSWMVSEIPNKYEFSSVLSDYDIYKDDYSSLSPANGMIEYQLATPLFTDYAAKQRLIRLPEGKTLNVNSDGSFLYPDSTLIVKTFYYPSIQSEQSHKYDIIETRLLYFLDNKWNVAVYEWNHDQTEAYLIKEGKTREAKWITPDGNRKSTKYKIPSLAECTTCHQSSDKVVPLGLELANMNVDIRIDSESVNQIDHLKNKGLFHASQLPQIDSFPKWNDTKKPLDRRARAYLDVNCSHCHTKSGFAGYTTLQLDYEIPLAQTGINKNKKSIRNRLKSKWKGEKMPLIGTTVIHDEGVELIEQYLNQLNMND
jgi:uncharacterized repeat protein (TIGR03806 family)